MDEFLSFSGGVSCKFAICNKNAVQLKSLGLKHEQVPLPYSLNNNTEYHITHRYHCFQNKVDTGNFGELP